MRIPNGSFLCQIRSQPQSSLAETPGELSHLTRQLLDSFFNLGRTPLGLAVLSNCAVLSLGLSFPLPYWRESRILNRWAYLPTVQRLLRESENGRGCRVPRMFKATSIPSRASSGLIRYMLRIFWTNVAMSYDLQHMQKQFSPGMCFL